MVDLMQFDFYVVFTMILCALGLQETLIALPSELIQISNQDKKLYNLPDTKVQAKKHHGKDCIGVGPLLVRHFKRNCLLQREATIIQCGIIKILSVIPLEMSRADVQSCFHSASMVKVMHYFKVYHPN